MGTGPGGSVFGENLFYRETRTRGGGGRHAVKRSSDTRVAHPEVKSSGTGLSVICGCCCPLRPADVQYSEKILCIEPQRVDRHKRVMPGAPSSGTPRKSQAKFRDETVWVL